MEPQSPQPQSAPGMRRHVVTPLPGQSNAPVPSPDPEAIAASSAADLIRQKLNRIYSNEPDAKTEEKEAEASRHRSKHQQFMYDLNRSGKSFVEIQTAWHEYYSALPESEKHEVWQEFYEANSHYKPSVQEGKDTVKPQAAKEDSPKLTLSLPKGKPFIPPALHAEEVSAQKKKPKPPQTVEETKAAILKRVQTRQKITRKQHVQSLIFGLGMGMIALVIMLFGFFNERIIAPFMTPSRSISDASIIIDPQNTQVGSSPQIIIPKINVQIPVVYDVPTIEEAEVQKGLERGVVHYAITPNPGEKGNAVIFGHSANNILNKGQYKFAFVLLHKLEINDTFYIDYNGTRYAYKIFERKIVPPTDVSVLYANDKPATMTLITCDPPGTNLKRLVLVAEQVSPDPTKNATSAVSQDASTAKPAELPSNSQSLWSRLWSWL